MRDSTVTRAGVDVEGTLTSLRVGPPMWAVPASGSTQHWRAQAIDAYGNATPVSRAVTTVPRDQSVAAAGPGWTIAAEPTAWRGSVLRSARRGARALFTFRVTATTDRG